MSGLNQCTYSFTTNTPLVQYYRVCITCTRNNGNNTNTVVDGSVEEQEVTICINCSAICHDGHKLSTVLRQKMFCHCSLKNGGNHCRVIPKGHSSGYNDDSDDQSNSGCCDHGHSHGHAASSSSSAKKRKYNTITAGHDHSHGHDHDHMNSSSIATNAVGSSCANNNSHSLILWSRYSKHDQDKKVLQQSHLMNIDDANRLAKETFVKSNPWSLSEQDVWKDPQFSMSQNKYNFLQLKMLRSPRFSDIPETWEVGVDSADNFLEEFCSFHAKEKESTGSPGVASHPSKKMAAPMGSSAVLPATSLARNNKTPSKKVILAEALSEDEDDDERVIFATNQPTTSTEEAIVAVTDGDDGGKKKKTTRPKKEAGAPKGPTPSYMIYCNMNRDKHHAENPGVTMIDLTRIIAQIWKNLPQSEKTLYEELAKADKKRYNIEMEEYKRKKADGTFIPPEIVPKTKGKPGPKPKVKDTAVVTSDVNRVEQIVIKDEIQDSELMSCSETNSAIDEEDVSHESDDLHGHDNEENHYRHHDEGAASDFEDL